MLKGRIVTMGTDVAFLKVVLWSCCMLVQMGKSQLAHVIQSPQSFVKGSEEQTTTSVDQQIEYIGLRIDQLESQLQMANANIKQVMESSPTVAELQMKNDELTQMLGKFERFFGSLYAEKPEAFDPEVAIETRMSKLNEYLGNREAELAGLRPSPMTVVDSHETFDPELLGKVLSEMNEQNSQLAAKVQMLQSKVDITLPSKGSRVDSGRADDTSVVRGKRQARDLQRQISATDNVEEISDELAHEIMDILSSMNTTSNLTSSSDADITDDSLTIEEEIDILAEDILGVPNTSRKRKSAFSAASTRSMFGTSEAQVMTFQHVFANKGRDFNAENGTFVCEINGYYFITFHLRSYDGRHLGVVLMKNEDVVTAIFSDASERNVMDSQSVILPLEKGDRVYLRLSPSERFAVYSDASYKYSTFSGFLLYRGN